jgi:hypothetical protein
VWFTDSCTPVEIGRITPAGAVTEFAGGGNPGSCPYFIAAGPDGNLWFSDEGTTPAVGRITPTGATTEFSAGLGASSLLYGIVAGPDGNVWFTDTGTTQAIGRITTPPVATTGGASVLGSGAARVDGTLNGHAQPTTDRFEFGPTAAYGATSSPVDAGAGFATEPATATLTGLTPNTTYHYRLDATNPTDTTPGADATFTTLALPLLGTVTVKPSRWRLGASLVQISRKRKRRAPVGTRISFSLDRAVPVQLQFSLRKPGRTVKKRCAAPTRRNRKARRCTRLLTAGVLAFPGHAGKNTIRFQGRISRSKRLRAGRYQLQVSATDLTSPTQSSSRGASFTIVRR